MKTIKIATALGLMILITSCESSVSTKLTNIEGLIPDLNFELMDENNKAVTAKDYLGSTVAIFFGFTSCPDVCPTTMHQMATVIKQLGDDGSSIKVLFISVDSARDTPEKLRQYTSLFGPAFIGLFGDEETLRALTKEYRVTYGYGDKDLEGNYEVSHSGALFIFDKLGKARLLATQSSESEHILDDLRVLLNEPLK